MSLQEDILYNFWNLSAYIYCCQLDGWIARNFESQASKMGSFLDPMADKVLIATLFLSLTYMDLIPGRHISDKFIAALYCWQYYQGCLLLQLLWQVRSLPGTSVLSQLPSMCATSLCLRLLVHFNFHCTKKTAVCMRRESKCIKCFLIQRTLSRYFDVTHATAQLSPTAISKWNTGMQLLLVASTLAAPVFSCVDHPVLHVMWYVCRMLCATEQAETVHI